MSWITGILVVAVLAIGAGWYVAGSGRRPLTSQERERLAPGKTIRLSDGFIHYVERGPAEGQVVVLVHGFGVPHFVFEQTAIGLVDAGYRVVMFDHFGRGWSDRPRASYDVDFFDRELSELITSLQLQQPVVIIGYSMGGVIAAEYAARHPKSVAALVLLAPAGLEIQPFLGKIFGRLLLIPLLGDWLWRIRGHALLMQDAVFTGSTDPDRCLQGDDTVQMAYKGYYNALLQSWRNLPMKDRDQLFGTASRAVPTLALFGDRDDIIPLGSASRLQNAAPDAEVEFIEGGTHVMTFELYDVVNPKIIDFLRRTLS
ncbi:MAG: alpha/beta hydrolase [Pseudomonadota bacterium]